MFQHMNPSDLLGMDVIGPDHDKIGTTNQVLLDDTTGQPTFVAVRTGLFGLRETVMPLAEAELVDGAIAVPYDKQTIKDAPNVEPDDQLSADDEARLYEYYNLSSDVGHDEQAEADRARLRKHVVTEQVQIEAPATYPTEGGATRRDRSAERR